MWKMKGGLINLHFGSHHPGNGKREVRKGEVAIMVGREGEERRRVVVPVDYLNHPLFTCLLKEAEEEYEFRHNGAVTIPCGFAEFSYVKGLIDNMREGDSHHRRSHHHNHHRIGCFGRA